MKKLRLLPLLCCLTMVCLFACRPAWAEDGAFLLQAISVIAQPSETRLEASVTIQNGASLHAALRDGAAFVLEMQVDLKRRRTVLPDKSVNTYTVQYQIRFDPLTREYLLIRPAQGFARLRNLPKLLELALADVILPLSPPALLDAGESYQASLTLALRYADVPPWLSQTLFFWSWDVIPPATFSLDFVADQPFAPAPAAFEQVP